MAAFAVHFLVKKNFLRYIVFSQNLLRFELFDTAVADM